MRRTIGFNALLVVLMVISLSCSSDSGPDDADTDDDLDDDLDDDSVDDTGCDDNFTKGELWVDPVTNLTWQTGNSCDGRYPFFPDSYCETLEIDGFSDWRLPSISEMRSLIRGCPATETGGECPLTDECQDWDECKDGICNGCEEGAGPTDGCYGHPEFQHPCSEFWTANKEICVRLNVGGVVPCNTGSNETGMSFLVRCVRP
jgi:hypothetical protein